MTHTIEADAIALRFGRVDALTDVSFATGGDGITVVLGPNGAGKSTLFACALGLLRPDRGRLSVLGLDPIADHDALCDRVGYVPSTPDAPAWMTAREYFRFLAPHYSRWNDGVVRRMVERYEVPLDRAIGALSRGEGAKVMLIGALAHEPECVLLDEPFSGLDPVVRRDLLRAFLDEFEASGRSALIATHDLEVAARLADRVLVLARGKVEAFGSTDEVLGQDDPARIPRGLYELLERVA